MKVFVMLKYPPLHRREFVDVKSTRKKAESAFRTLFPHMRIKDETLISDANMSYILEIKEMEID